MAEAMNGMLGGVSGKVGPVIGVRWRGRYFWRSKARKSTKPFSEKQRIQQEKMALVSSFLAKIRGFINQYTPMRQGEKSLINGTEQQSSFLLRHGIGYEGDRGYLQLNLVTVSIGTLPVAHIHKIQLTEDKQIKLEWEDNSYNSMTAESDLLSVVIFHNEEEEFQIYDTVGQRMDKIGLITLKEQWTYGTIHIWTMWKNKEEKLNSTSLYHEEIALD
ncbi:hypothetical protein E0Z07_11055 [Myroides odoratimimus]|uniref:DUF6266 family protein n=1 Tax=Myroides odoratimimus TaxID=76832 RepID=UPI00103C8708|nr:DUF6266 family protein [Myroides odoratimimus]MDM1457634.1 hypothetical protein [Myroides odoratimimus]MEC4086136.1 DUF6266 family protein [Myroides odoratimimus]QBK76844.1 hypothetical protein E0Z07_11055 [Myroides odoratimimus]